MNWYSNPEGSSSEILSGTLTQAKCLLSTVLKPKEFQALFPGHEPNGGDAGTGHHSMEDVLRVLLDAQGVYQCRTGLVVEPFRSAAATVMPGSQPSSSSSSGGRTANKSRVKARVWLTGLSEKIVCYGNILDVMVQQHPEYVSLAWGTFKLLFTAIINHAETASKLAKAIYQIADILPQQSLLLILYPTKAMQESVARLYAYILQFFLDALTWYRNRRAVHAIKAIFQPWDLSFRKHFEAIAAESLQIGRLADTAAKAELRDTRLQVMQGARHCEDAKLEIQRLRQDNERLASIFEARIGYVDNFMHKMHDEIRLDLHNQRAILNRVHFNQMLSLPLWNNLPTSGESLHYCMSLRKRRREYTKLPLPEIDKLQRWDSMPTSSLLVIDTYLPSLGKIFMIDMINLIREHRMPIVWALRYAGYWERRPTVIDLVRMLVLQTMHIYAERLLEEPFPVAVEHLLEAAGLEDWIAILNRLFMSRKGSAFIVLDSDLLSFATDHERREAIELVEMLRARLSCHAKILVSSANLSRSYVEDLSDSDACVKIQVDCARDWRQRRRVGRPLVRFRR